MSNEEENNGDKMSIKPQISHSNHMEDNQDLNNNNDSGIEERFSPIKIFKDVQEVHTFGRNVQLGCIYNSSTGEWIPPKTQKIYRCEAHNSWEWFIYNKSFLKEIQAELFDSTPWFKDYKANSDQEIIEVLMVKHSEKKSCENIESLPNQKVATSLVYKTYLNLILIYEAPVPDTFSSDLSLVLDGIMKEDHPSVPPSISKGMKKLKVFDDILVDETEDLEAGLRNAFITLNNKNVCEIPLSVIVSNGKVEKNLKLSEIVDDPCGMKRYYYGEASSKKQEKVLLLLGASGSGKTTLVNFIGNYFGGVKTPDNKFFITPTLTKTKEISAYTFVSEKDKDTAITIIDTPGLNDASGAEIRDHVNSLKKFLANTASHDLKIHGLGFVAQAHLVRLTSSERLVMDYVSTLFGENVKDNIITFVTFADVQDNPPLVEAMRSYGLKTKHFYKFNNAVLQGSSDEIDEIERVYWRTGCRNWKKTMKYLHDVSPLSINAMKQLQTEVYNKTVVENSVKELDSKMVEFISTFNEGIPLKIRISSYQVWDFVTVAHHHLCLTPEGSASVENLLLKSMKKSCPQLHSNSSLVYLRALLFYSPKGLDKCAKEIIECIQSAYLHATNYEKSQNGKDRFQMFYCKQCMAYSLFERNDPTLSRIGWRTATFKCTVCQCNGKEIYHCSPSNSIVNNILQHTKNRLANVIKLYPLKECNMTIKDLLMFLMKEENEFNKEFINEIKHIS